MDDSVSGGVPSSESRPGVTMSGLRARLQMNAPDAVDPTDVPDAFDARPSLPEAAEFRLAKERIVTLETLLTQSRAREDALTTQGFKDQATIARFGAKNAELAAIAAGAATNEAARREAESAAAEAERRTKLAHDELETRLVEMAQLRERCLELQKDLDTLAGQAAAATIARAEADRMMRERDEARERAETERGLAAQDRARAEASERLAATLRGRSVAERERAALAGARPSVAQQKRSMAPPVPKLVGATPPWIELQRGSSEQAAPSATVLPWPPKEPKVAESAEAEPPETGATDPIPAAETAEEIIDLSDG
jgi:hypothetical protein